MKNRKDILIVISIILVSLLLIIAISISEKKEEKKSAISSDPEVIMQNAQKESEDIKDNERGQLNIIDTDKYLEYYGSDINHLVLIARPTCSYCEIATPIIEKIKKDYNIEINYLNTDDFTEDDEKKIEESDEFFKDGFGTPILLNIGNNKIIDKVDGLTDTYHYIKFLKDNKYI